jgi:hypothetical protein
MVKHASTLSIRVVSNKRHADHAVSVFRGGTWVLPQVIFTGDPQTSWPCCISDQLHHKHYVPTKCFIHK